jgi:hypothetical protein
MSERKNLPEDLVILIEDQSEARRRLEEQESLFQSRVVGLFAGDEKTKQFSLNGKKGVSLQISKIIKDEEEKEEEIAIDLKDNLISKRICTVAPIGTVLGKSQRPCCLDEISRLNRVLDLFSAS